MPKVTIIGSNGMLGSAVTARLRATDHEVVATTRSGAGGTTRFVAGESVVDELLSDAVPGDVVVNCAGLIKQRMSDSSWRDRRAAITVNAEFPYDLASAAVERGVRVIQIATDCVFSGETGSYNEESHQDALDVYGKSKSLGEVPAPGFLNIRCSIIGRELVGGTSLTGWLLSQPRDATINGYLDHRWNGVTTSAFADLAAGLIEAGADLEGTIHLVPQDAVDKRELSVLLLDRFDRNDVTVRPFETGRPVDRTLATINPDLNDALWNLAGYERPPRIEEMIATMP